MKFKWTKTLSLLVAIFFLNACTIFDTTSGMGSRDQYRGWNCTAASDDSDQWYCTRGATRDAEPVKTEPENTEPPLESKGQNKIEPKVDKIVQQLPRQPVEAAFDISADGYTVQLGAYLSQAMAEQSADKIIVAEGELRVRNIISAGRHSFVIVSGQYRTRQQAQKAVEGIRALNPQLEYWVRTIQSLRDSL